MLRSFAVFLAATAFTGAAFAQDSTSRIDAGGLELQQPEQIEIKKQNLYISRSEIKGTLVVRNATAADIEAGLVFKLPDAQADPEAGRDADWLVGAGKNLLGFNVLVNGKQIAPTPEQRAILVDQDNGEKDVTSLLNALHLPIFPMNADMQALIAKLSPADIKDLKDQGLIYQYPEEDGDWWPRWTMRGLYKFTERFPAGEDVSLAYSYQPLAGSSPSAPFLETDTYFSEYAKTFCLDRDLVKSAQKLIAEKKFKAFMNYEVGYITGANSNWAGGKIGEFTMVVDKGDVDNFVSLCGDGIKKVSPTTFEIKKNNFTPDARVDVWVLVPDRT